MGEVVIGIWAFKENLKLCYVGIWAFNGVRLGKMFITI